MKAAAIAEIKTALQNLPASKLATLCLQLAKYKKDNKELLSYLLFEDNNLAGYIASVKIEIDELFLDINKTNLYFAKKTIRKILRITNKHVRYTGSKQAEAELLIYFCRQLKASGIRFEKNTALANLYQSQIKKINQAVESFHEDLQFDFLKELASIA